MLQIQKKYNRFHCLRTIRPIYYSSTYKVKILPFTFVLVTCITIINNIEIHLCNRNQRIKGIVIERSFIHISWSYLNGVNFRFPVLIRSYNFQESLQYLRSFIGRYLRHVFFPTYIVLNFCNLVSLCTNKCIQVPALLHFGLQNLKVSSNTLGKCLRSFHI